MKNTMLSVPQTLFGSAAMFNDLCVSSVK